MCIKVEWIYLEFGNHLFGLISNVFGSRKYSLVWLPIYVFYNDAQWLFSGFKIWIKLYWLCQAYTNTSYQSIIFFFVYFFFFFCCHFQLHRICKAKSFRCYHLSRNNFSVDTKRTSITYNIHIHANVYVTRILILSVEYIQYCRNNIHFKCYNFISVILCICNEW